ncbi:MAG: DUF1080 domain-containing protein, partial [Saprospiraceae bacterium]|nr:DUF1080 domain-containing protein [Saprospiraceae bacterium]
MAFQTLRCCLFGLFLALISCAPSVEQTEVAEDKSQDTSDTSHNTLTDEEIKQGWMLLFDGISTEHWRGYNQDSFPERGWIVDNGDLVVQKSGTEEAGFGGDIITIEQFQDFVFSFDFMLSDSANSGILYLVQEADNTPIWNNAPEYQILDNPTYTEMLGAEWMPTHRTAENYDLHAADQDHCKPPGEWNTGMIRKSGTHVQHWLNGNLVV